MSRPQRPGGNKKPKKLVTIDEVIKREEKKMEREEKSKTNVECLKFHYDDPRDFIDKNLPCEDRKWEDDSFDNIEEYTPHKMDEYVDKYFGNENFDGDSPFAFQTDYKYKNINQICDQKDFTLNPQQKFIGKFISPETDFPGALIYHGLGSGKCMEIDTPILMYDGSIKKVQDVVVGDFTMGDDSTKREVLSLGRGKDTMYEIKPVKGEAYTFNSEHILCLKPSNQGVSYKIDKRVKNQIKKWVVSWLDTQSLTKKGKWFETEDEAVMYFKKIKNKNDIVQIPIYKYIKLPKSTKSQLKLYRTKIDFEERVVPFDPYILGLWIGDGNSGDPCITTQDSVVIKYLKETLPGYNMYLRWHSGYTYRMCSIDRKNPFLEVLRDLNLLNNKHIPEIYKINTEIIRSKVLAGLIDSDGYCGKNVFEITQNNNKTTEDIVYITRSLGLAAYKNVKKTSWTYKGVKKYSVTNRISISGELTNIPVKIKRKIPTERKQRKNVLVTGFEVIEKPYNNYYGFTVDKNHRFVLGDFTVTHNTCSSIIIAEAMKAKTTQNLNNQVFIKGRGRYHVYMVVPKAVKEQYYEEIIGRIKDGKIVSCPGACVITEDDAEETGARQFYVGSYDKRTGKYDTNDLNDIRDLENRINRISSDKRLRQDQEDTLNNLKKQLKEKRKEFHGVVNAVYHIISHDTFLNSIMVKVRNEKKFVPTPFLLTDNMFHSDKSLVIIDEVQKLVSEKGSKFYRLFNSLMIYARNRNTGNPTMRMVLLTATPVYDNPHEAALMINLLRPRIQFPLNRDKFREMFVDTKIDNYTKTKVENLKNPVLLQYILSGYVSYFKGGNPEGYPLRRNFLKIHRMENFQEDVYIRSLSIEALKDLQSIKHKKKEKMKGLQDSQKEGIYPISIQKCNIAYDKDSDDLINNISDAKALLTTLKKVKASSKGSGHEAVLDKARNYSAKLVSVIETAMESPGPVFIYTKWILHGIVGLSTILDALGWKFLDEKYDISNEGKNYAIWSPGGLEFKGLQSEHRIEEYIKNMRQIFNSPENKDGKLCKILISNVVEGISLKHVNQVHVCEPWWNLSKLEQIIARGIRLCSHSGLPEDRQYVDVYYHASILNSYPNYNFKIQRELTKMDESLLYFKDLTRSTIEQKMFITADRKNKLNNQFEIALKQSAVDCKLNKQGNIVRLEEYVIPSTTNNKELMVDGRYPLYNRSSNKYYILKNDNTDEYYLTEIDLINTMDVHRRKEGEYNTVYNWPPVDIEVMNKNKIYLDKWQVKEKSDGLSVTLYEDLKCDIDQPEISKLNFNEAYNYAMGQGENISAWKYAQDMFIKMKLFGLLVVKYDLMSGSPPVEMVECLNKLLTNKKFWDTIAPKERRKHKAQLKSLLLED